MSIEKILEHVRKTNPTITMDKLIKELSKSRYPATALIITCMNSGKTKSLPS